jgi:excisionase family DNA binding protein
MVTMEDLTAKTFAPPERDRPELSKIEEFLDERRGVELHLAIGADTSIVVPQVLDSIVRMAARALSQGLAVSIVPQAHVLTTQQAAEILGMSRPTLVRLLESDALPFQKIGTHRRLLLDDVLRYREERRRAQYQFLADTAVDEDEDIEIALDRLRRVRAKANG